MKNIKIAFGLKIKELRMQKLYSQNQLAKLTSIDKSYISDIENGNSNVSLKIIEKLAKAFEIEIYKLFE